MQDLNSASPAWSFWERDIYPRPFDLAIIGGGLVGLSAALSVRDRSPALRIAVLERGAFPSGASTRNAGFACFGSMTELLGDIDHMGEEATWQLVEQRWQGLRHLRQRLGDRAISWEGYGGYELFRADDEEAFIRCLDHLPAFNRRLQDITGEPEVFSSADRELASCGFAGIRHRIRNRLEGQLHPGRMMQALEQLARDQGIHVLYGLDVQAIRESGSGFELVHRGERSVAAGKVLVANNGFARQLLPGLDLWPARNQVLVTRPVKGGLPWQGCYHYRQGYIYFRSVGDRILLGGARDQDPEGEATDQFGSHAGIRRALEHFLREVIAPERGVDIEQWWSGILGLGSKKKPLAEEVRPGLYLALRLSGMGIALGSRLGEEIARKMFPER